MRIIGISASPGIAIGRAQWMRTEAAPAETRHVEPGQADAEAQRFDEAVRQAVEELEKIRRKMADEGRGQEAEIFEAHLMLLDDEELIGASRSKIKDESYAAESAITETADEVAEVIASLDDPYLRERAADIRDVSRRIVRILGGQSTPVAASADGDKRVLLAADLSPSDTALLDLSAVAGFVTAAGGKTSHSAIIARGIGIPAVVGAGSALADVRDGQWIALDGAAGTIDVDPEPSVVERYRKLADEAAMRAARYEAYRVKTSVSADGARVELVANIGAAEEAAAAKRQGAEGIGLFRTEFLYMGRNDLPSEEEQFEAYRKVCEAFGPEAPIVIRTMDIGGDKKLQSLGLEPEDNPFLGYRAIRICLDRPALFRTQLRAILRAGAYGNVKAMFPMIATVGEWRRAKAMLEAAKAELRAEGANFNEAIETGLMIEIPAAAMMADRLAREADFFSIGTNDLVQYTMAADRMNPKLGYLADPLHPPVLRLIDRVIRAAHAEGKWVGMCGEMAGHPLALPILLGMGLDEFSMSAGSVARARWLIAQLPQADLREAAAAVLDMEDAADVRAYVERHVPKAMETLES
jgi:phosphotransferase system enzyme I (PtsI)